MSDKKNTSTTNQFFWVLPSIFWGLGTFVVFFWTVIDLAVLVSHILQRIAGGDPAPHHVPVSAMVFAIACAIVGLAGTYINNSKLPVPDEPSGG